MALLKDFIRTIVESTQRDRAGLVLMVGLFVISIVLIVSGLFK